MPDAGTGCYTGASVARSLSGPGWSPQPLLSVCRLVPFMTQDWTEGQEPLPSSVVKFVGQPISLTVEAPSWGQTLQPCEPGTDKQTHAQRREDTGEDRRGRVPEGAPSLPVLPGLRGTVSGSATPPSPPATGRRDLHPSPLHLKRTNWALSTFSISQQPCRKKLLSLFPDDRRETRLHQRSPRERPWKRSRRTPPGSAASPLRRSKEILP